MTLWSYLLDLLAGAFLCNAIPHLACGLSGRKLPTPFARPPGWGYSSALVNFVWGAGNLLAGVLLLAKWPAQIGLNSAFAAFCVGFVLIGCGTSSHFAKARAKTPDL